MSPTIREARTQIQEQKQLLAGKREEASKAQTQLRNVLSKLPQVTQRALRGAGSFAGLKGRLRRRVLERTKKDIGEKEELIKSYGTSLTKYEEETLKPFEADVARVESQIAQAKVEEAAFEKAQKLFEDKISPYWVTGPEYKYLKRFYQDKAAAKKAFYSQVEKFETDFPAEKLDVDWGKLRIKEVDSEAFGQTLSIKDYNKRIADFNKKIGGGSIVSDFVESSKGLSRIDKEKELKGLRDISISRDLFPLVSAQQRTTEIPSRNLSGTTKLSLTGGVVKSFKDIFSLKGPQIKSQYFPEQNITLVSAQAPQFGTIQTDPLTLKPLKITTSIYPGDISKLQGPKIPEILGSGVRSLGERIPVFKDIIKSKDIINIKAKKSQDILRQLQDPNLSSKQIQGLIKKFERIGGDVKKEIKDGETIYQFYEPTIEIGSTRRTRRDVPVAQLSNQGLFRYSTGLLAGELGSIYTEIGKDVGLKEEGIKQYTTKEKDVTFFEPQFGTIQTDPLTGKEILFKEVKVKVPSKTYKIGTPGQIGKAVEFGVEAGLFPITYTGGLAEATITGGEFGGPKTPLGYVKKYPWETAVLGTIGIGSLGAKGVKFFRTPELKVTELMPKGSLGESLYSVSRPLKREIYVNPLTGKTIVRETSKISGAGKTIIIPGEKVEVVTGLRKIIDYGQKPLTRRQSLRALRRTSDYSMAELEAVEGLGKLSKKDFVDKLVKQGEGISRKRAEKLFLLEGRIKETIRLRRPQVFKDAFEGEGIVKYGEEASEILIIGKETPKFYKGETGGVKWLKSSPKKEKIVAKGLPAGKSFEFITIKKKITPKSKEKPKIFKSSISSRKIKSYEPIPIEKYSQLERTQQIKPFKEDIIFPSKDYLKSFKDREKVILPLRRKSKFESSKVFIEKGEPRFIITDESILATRGFQGGGKKSSKQFLEQMYKAKEGLASGVSLIKKPKPISKIPKTPKTIAEVTEKPAQSLYFGKGMYERTGGGMFPLVSGKQEQFFEVSPVYLPSRLERQFVEIDTKQRLRPFQILDTKSKLKIGEDYKQKEKFVSSFRQPQIFKQTSKQKELLRQKEKVKQVQRQSFIQKQKTSLQFQRPRPGPKKPKKPKKPKTPPKIIKIFDLEKEKEKRKRLKKKGRELFIPFVKRYGKFAAISKPTTFKRALRKGTGRLLTTLGASLQIRGAKTGKPIKIAKETKIFRAGKKGKDPFTLVQRRGARLGRRQEVMEIIKARGMKWF